MHLALRKCKNDIKILTIVLVPDFCPLKPEIARFCIGFRLTFYSLQDRQLCPKSYFRIKFNIRFSQSKLKTTLPCNDLQSFEMISNNDTVKIFHLLYNGTTGRWFYGFGT